MTISDYLQNPYGKGSAISNVTAQKDNLLKEYGVLQSKFITKIYLYRGEAIFHVIVPSRNREDQTYDVVIQVHVEDTKEADVNLENNQMLVFSNCPSFIFTYANAFRKRGFNIKWLDSKYDKNVKNNATTKNEYGIIGLERSLYLACLHLNKTRRTEMGSVLSTSIKPTSFNQISKWIRSQDEIMRSIKTKVKKNQLEEKKTETPKTAEKRDTRNRVGFKKVDKIQSAAQPVKKTAKLKSSVKKANETTKKVKHI